MEYFQCIRRGFFPAVLVAVSFLFSACEKTTAPRTSAEPREDEPVVEQKVDDTVPLVVHPVGVIAGEGSDAVFVTMLNRMLMKVTENRADLKFTAVDEVKDGIVVVLGEVSEDMKIGLASRNTTIVRVGDHYADDPNVAVSVGVDSVFAAGQFGEAVRAAADDHGEVMISPVPTNNLTIANKLSEFGKYLARVAPSSNGNGYVLVASNKALPDEKACLGWLEEAITPRSSDQELAAIVGLTRRSTHNALLRLRAVGLSETVPLVGYGIDQAIVDAMDAGEVVGVFVMDPGTLESALRVALDKAAKMHDAVDEVVNEEEPLVVPLRWVSFDTLGSPEGGALAAPYLESEPVENGE